LYQFVLNMVRYYWYDILRDQGALVCASAKHETEYRYKCGVSTSSLILRFVGTTYFRYVPHYVAMRYILYFFDDLMG
jgi:hypothetical protein